MGKFRILVVEDNVDLRTLIAINLEEAGYQIEEADDVLSAEQLLRDSRFDLVLSDFEMPGGSGLDIFETIQRLNVNLPFVLMSGSESLDAKFLRKRGVSSFVQKPFTFASLENVIRESIHSSSAAAS